MKPNTVILPLKDYNELIQSAKDLNELYKGQSDIVFYETDRFARKRYSYTKDEIVKQLIEEKNFLIKELNDSRSELNRLKSKQKEIVHPEYQNKKRISFWEYLFGE